MNNGESLIARMRLAAEIETKFKLVDQLRDRCMQKAQEIESKYGEAKEVESADAKLKEIREQLEEAEPAFSKLAERYGNATPSIGDLSDPRFDRTAPALLESLKRLQSVWEAELLLLDDLLSQLEGRQPS